MSVEEVFVHIERHRRELAEVCSQLIQRPSAHPKGHTLECVTYIQDYFDQLGIPTEVYRRNEEKPNIVARVKGTGNKKIMWVGHLDVVPEGAPELWSHPPYGGEITEDGLIWGRGSSDMKGACAAAMVAARVLSTLKEVPNSIDFWFTADEEVGGRDGALWLAQERLLDGDVCIIGDGSPGTPQSPAIDLGCKGVAGARLKAQGRTAHGSRPFLGDNALDKLLKVIPFVKQIADYPLEIPDELEATIATTIEYMMREEFDEDQQSALERLFHYPSVTLNLLNGGVKTNVIPDYADAYFDIRLTPGSNPVKVRERISALVKAAGETGVTVEFPRPSKTTGYYESLNTLFAQQLAEVVEKTTGNQPIFKLLTGGTDAIGIKQFIDLPCLGFGSSIEGQAHSPNEHNSIELLVMSCKVYAAFPLIYRDDLAS